MTATADELEGSMIKHVAESVARGTTPSDIVRDLLFLMDCEIDAALTLLRGIPKGLAVDSDDWLPEGWDVWAFGDRA